MDDPSPQMRMAWRVYIGVIGAFTIRGIAAFLIAALFVVAELVAGPATSFTSSSSGTFQVTNAAPGSTDPIAVVVIVLTVLLELASLGLQSAVLIAAGRSGRELTRTQTLGVTVFAIVLLFGSSWTGLASGLLSGRGALMSGLSVPLTVLKAVFRLTAPLPFAIALGFFWIKMGKDTLPEDDLG